MTVTNVPLTSSDRAAITERIRRAWGLEGVDITWATSYAEVDEVFKSSDFEIGGHHGESAPFRASTLVMLHGEEHFERRRVEAPLFRRTALRVYDAQVLAPALRRELERCVRQRGFDGRVRADLLPLVRSALLRLSVVIAGIDNCDTPERLDRLRRYKEKMGEANGVEWSPRDHAVVMREALEAKERFAEEFFRPSWERRLQLVAAYEAGEIDELLLPADHLTLLARNRKHFQQWDDDLFLREFILFTGSVAGSPANAVPHAVAEIAHWVGVPPRDAARLERPEFLWDAVAETLRLHPPGPPKLRCALHDTTLASGRRVRAGEHLLLDTAAANRDPAVFGPNADKFQLPRNFSPVNPFGLVFGGGAHACIGLGLTMGQRATAPDEPLGMLVRILFELYRAGMRPDSERPPRRIPGSISGNYYSYPVLFERL